MGSVSQVQKRACIKILPFMPLIAIVPHGGNANIDICFWNMDTHERARKDDQISAKKDAPPRRLNKEKIQTNKHKKKRAKMKGRRVMKKAQLAKETIENMEKKLKKEKHPIQMVIKTVMFPS